MAEQHQISYSESSGTAPPLGSEYSSAVPTSGQSSRPLPETPPQYPPRPVDTVVPQQELIQGTSLREKQAFPPPPQRKTSDYGDSASLVHYIRDPHKLIAYLVPFPKPDIHKGFLHKADATNIPDRFLIYTPPPPPLTAPKEGEKEDRMHKLQQKW
jgi:hypothetical protein